MRKCSTEIHMHEQQLRFITGIGFLFIFKNSSTRAMITTIPSEGTIVN